MLVMFSKVTAGQFVFVLLLCAVKAESAGVSWFQPNICLTQIILLFLRQLHFCLSHYNKWLLMLLELRLSLLLCFIKNIRPH